MKFLFPFFALFCIIFTSLLKNNTRDKEKSQQEFWERERIANLTRKKDISNLDYITIPTEKLPFLKNPSEKISDYEERILKLSKCRILNLNGISNTDLKLSYGVANLPDLTQYDQNYLELTTILGKWSQALLDEGYTGEAKTVLEYAVSCGCDSSSIYVNLATIYMKEDPQRVNELIDNISSSESPMKNIIIHKLQNLIA
ncbi:MAG: hypothetical protein ACI4GD_12700 [Lachnospiraceae bacterium]